MIEDDFRRNAVRILSYFVFLALAIFTLAPASLRPVTGVEHNFEHFLAFAFARLLFAYSNGIRVHRFVVFAIIFTFALELLQIPLPTRHARFADFVINALGVLMGGIPILCLRGRRLTAGLRSWFVVGQAASSSALHLSNALAAHHHPLYRRSGPSLSSRK